MRGAQQLVRSLLYFDFWTGARRRFLPVVLTGLPVLGLAATAAAQPVHQPQILVLQSFDRGNIVLDNFTTTFMSNWTSVPNNR